MKRLLCSVLCLMLLYVPFAHAAVDATQADELLAGAYQQGLTANGLMMGAEFDAELQQLDITLRDDQFTLEQMEAKEFQDALAMLCARTYGEAFQKLRDKWGEDLDILIHVVDVNGDELYRVKNNIPLRGKGEVRSEADQQKMLDQATNYCSSSGILYTIRYLPQEDCLEISTVVEDVTDLDWQQTLMNQSEYETTLADSQMAFSLLDEGVRVKLDACGMDANIRIIVLTADETRMFSLLNGMLEE